MEQFTHHEKLVKKTTFDETTLTNEQRQAVAIARTQGVAFSRKFDDLVSDLSSEDAEELSEAIEENLKRDRHSSDKSFF